MFKANLTSNTVSSYSPPTEYYIVDQANMLKWSGMVAAIVFVTF